VRVALTRTTAIARLAGLVRDGWWVCSAPERFFRARAAQDEPQPARAAVAAVTAVAGALGVLSLAFVRATASEGAALVWLAAMALGLPALGLGVLLGGLVLLRPAALDLQAWELVAWAWVPAGALALSLLPAVFVAPTVAALAGLAAFPVWHLVIVRAGLRALAPGRVGAGLGRYLVAIFVVPPLLAAIGVATLRGMS
jgi:hypothetical protein